jgi:hypothetical protein
VGLGNEAAERMTASLSYNEAVQCLRIESATDFPHSFAKSDKENLIWGRDRIGIGFLQALREKRGIVFEDIESPFYSIPSQSGHLVVCEDGEEIAQVIAANYAFALDAGLHLIPAVSREESEAILEAFYTVSDKEGSPTEAQQRLRKKLLNLCGSLPVSDNGSITFVGRLPYGFAYPEYPSTHLFNYPDLGCAVLNGFAAEQDGTPGTGVVALVDPGTTPAPEIEAAVKLLKPRHAFVRVYADSGANVRHVSDMLQYFPFDLLIIATHCGDSGGHRWTYRYKDSEDINRELVVDIAIGISRTDDPELLRVGQFIRFISLDGVDWSDPIAKEELYVGSAILDFTRLTMQGPKELEPVRKDTVPRVVGSAAMKMWDHNLLFAFPTIADVGTPIVINNACLSWHRLAGDMTFAGARAYVGTLFEVLPFEAEAVVLKILDKHWGKPLPVAVWAAQRDVYQGDTRRPYVASGVFPQRLRVTTLDYPRWIYERVARGLMTWTARLKALDPNVDDKKRKDYEEIIKAYRREVRHFAGYLDDRS